MKFLQNKSADLKAYEDTLRRLLSGDFDNLPPEERKAKTEQIIKTSAVAAMAMGAVPVPLLEMPVMAAMVRAIGRVYGVNTIGKKAMLEIAAAMGGGMVARQAMRLIPFVGAMAGVSRVYGSTWAVGRVAEYYFSRGQAVSGEDMRRVFKETMEAKQQEQGGGGDSIAERLRTLDDLYEKRLISEQEFRSKKKQLLDAI